MRFQLDLLEEDGRQRPLTHLRFDSGLARIKKVPRKVKQTLIFLRWYLEKKVLLLSTKIELKLRELFFRRNTQEIAYLKTALFFLEERLTSYPDYNPKGRK